MSGRSSHAIRRRAGSGRCPRRSSPWRLPASSRALFGLRAGAVAAPILALLLWRGAGAPLLLAAAGVLLAVVVPLVYLLFPVENRNGFNPAYSVENVEAHWVAVAAWVLLAFALWRILSTASRRGAGAGRSEP